MTEMMAMPLPKATEPILNSDIASCPSFVPDKPATTAQAMTAKASTVTAAKRRVEVAAA
jgi:hypothetical protein